MLFADADFYTMDLRGMPRLGVDTSRFTNSQIQALFTNNRRAVHLGQATEAQAAKGAGWITLPNPFHLDGAYNWQYMFRGCTALQDVDITGLSQTKDGSFVLLGAFSACPALKTVKFSTSGVKIAGSTHMTEMFADSVNLESVVFTKDTSIVTYAMQKMFKGCAKLKTVDLQGIATSGFGWTVQYDDTSTASMVDMFLGCDKIVKTGGTGSETSADVAQVTVGPHVNDITNGFFSSQTNPNGKPKYVMYKNTKV